MRVRVRTERQLLDADRSDPLELVDDGGIVLYHRACWGRSILLEIQGDQLYLTFPRCPWCRWGSRTTGYKCMISGCASPTRRVTGGCNINTQRLFVCQRLFVLKWFACPEHETIFHSLSLLWSQGALYQAGLVRPQRVRVLEEALQERCCTKKWLHGSVCGCVAACWLAVCCCVCIFCF